MTAATEGVTTVATPDLTDRHVVVLGGTSGIGLESGHERGFHPWRGIGNV